MNDYYKILEVHISSSQADIKKAYRKLALKWHPDKNPEKKDEAKKRFQEISEAYEVLSDEKKRKIYDQYGKEGLINGGRHHRAESYEMPFGFFTFRDPEDVFREFFGSDPFSDFFGIGNARRHSTNGAVNRHQDVFSFFPGFGGFGGFGGLDMFGGSGFNQSFTTFTSSTSGFNDIANKPGVKKTTTSTRFVNGRKIETRKIVENGVETVTIIEDGALKSKTVNGVPQALAYQ